MEVWIIGKQFKLRLTSVLSFTNGGILSGLQSLLCLIPWWDLQSRTDHSPLAAYSSRTVYIHNCLDQAVLFNSLYFEVTHNCLGLSYLKINMEKRFFSIFFSFFSFFKEWSPSERYLIKRTEHSIYIY